MFTFLEFLWFMPFTLLGLHVIKEYLNEEKFLKMSDLNWDDDNIRASLSGLPSYISNISPEFMSTHNRPILRSSRPLSQVVSKRPISHGVSRISQVSRGADPISQSPIVSKHFEVSARSSYRASQAPTTMPLSSQFLSKWKMTSKVSKKNKQQTSKIVKTKVKKKFKTKKIAKVSKKKQKISKKFRK